MGRTKIQQVFDKAWDRYAASCHPSVEQMKTANAIIRCKTRDMGCNVSVCDECGHTETHFNSCRNRNCPNCQAILKELWVDKRRAEVIDAPYYHVVFTIPHDLNSLVYCNQELLYSLMHKATSDTLIQLSRTRKNLGFTPGIIQVLHTWGQNLSYHPHIHCIISGGGLTPCGKLRKVNGKFFLPVRVMRDLFKGKFLDALKALNSKGSLVFAGACSKFSVPDEWRRLINSLYERDWCPFIKETFNGFGNAIEYLGRYTHRIAISNSRILSVTDDDVCFSAFDYKTRTRHTVTLNNTEFIRRFMMHVLPKGFQKIRYFGFLNNRYRVENLKKIFRLQGYQKFRTRLQGLSMSELLAKVWKIDVTTCRCCGCIDSMKPFGRTFALRC